MTNAQIARAFEKIGDILSLKDENPFRIRAYQRAAQTILSMSEDLEMMYRRRGKDALNDIPGIGDDLSAKIEELVETGKLEYLTNLEKEVPAGLIQITGIQGMGPKKTKFVWEKFKVTSVDELEKLAKSDKLTGEPGWGPKSVENVLAGIVALRTHSERVALPTAMVLADSTAGHAEAVAVRAVGGSPGLRIESPTLRRRVGRKVPHGARAVAALVGHEVRIELVEGGVVLPGDVGEAGVRVIRHRIPVVSAPLGAAGRDPRARTATAKCQWPRRYPRPAPARGR